MKSYNARSGRRDNVEIPNESYLDRAEMLLGFNPNRSLFGIYFMIPKFFDQVYQCISINTLMSQCPNLIDQAFQ